MYKINGILFSNRKSETTPYGLSFVYLYGYETEKYDFVFSSQPYEFLKHFVVHFAVYEIMFDGIPHNLYLFKNIGHSVDKNIVSGRVVHVDDVEENERAIDFVSCTVARKLCELYNDLFYLRYFAPLYGWYRNWIQLIK